MFGESVLDQIKVGQLVDCSESNPGWFNYVRVCIHFCYIDMYIYNPKFVGDDHSALIGNFYQTFIY